MTLNPGLYVTATPIGNLKDITLRALDTLRGADLILCEDTRVTGKLCQAHQIKSPLKAYHDHNGAEMRPLVLERLQNDQVIALVSDAGTPLISDPGYKLVRAVRDAGLPVFTVPGASAMTAGLSIAGAPTDRFFFAGFLPPKAGARKSVLQELAAIPASQIFYEAGPRLAGTLTDMASVFGDRRAAICRELTKLHEEVVEGRLSVLAERYNTKPPRGEIVVIVYPPEGEILDDLALSDLLTTLLQENSLKDAASIAAEKTGMPRKKLYDLALALKDNRK